MKKNIPLQLTFLTACALTLSVARVQAQGTTFTYQGRLTENGNPADGSYDMEFYLRDAPTGGNPVGATNGIAPVAVSNGLFTAVLDFGGGIFTGPGRWLEIGVRTNGSVGPYTILLPRQALTPSPYAIFAGGANTAPWANLTGVSVGPGLNLGGGNSVSVNFSGNGVANSAARSDHNHFGQTWTGTAGDGLTINNLSSANFAAGFLGIQGSPLVGPTTPSGVRGSSSAGYGVLGIGTSVGGVEGLADTAGVFGFAQDLSANSVGVQGNAASTNGSGVFGYAFASSGVTLGVHGQSASPKGYGGWFENHAIPPAVGQGAAVRGLASTASSEDLHPFGYWYSAGGEFAGPDGVIAAAVLNSNNIDGYGVIAMAPGTNNDARGVYGWARGTVGLNYGLYGQSDSPNGQGIYGLANSAQPGSSYGVHGLTYGPTGKGVFGEAASSTGTNYGLYGSSASPDGYGVYGIHTAATGTNAGVQGITMSTDRFAAGVFGSVATPLAAEYSAGVLGYDAGTNFTGIGVFGHHEGGGFGVYGETVRGHGVFGRVWSPDAGPASGGANASGVTGENLSTNASTTGVLGRHWGPGTGVLGTSTSGIGVQGLNSLGYSGVLGGTNAALVATAPAATSTAISVQQGTIQVAGAGLGSSTAAFIHLATTNNTPAGSYITTINNPICNGDPRAILIATHSWNPPGVGGNYETHPYSVYFDGVHWTIYNDDFASILGMSFNVLIIKP